MYLLFEKTYATNSLGGLLPEEVEEEVVESEAEEEEAEEAEEEVG